MEIEKLNLKQWVKVELHKANLTTVNEVLNRPVAELRRILKIDPQEFDELLQVTSQTAVDGCPTTALQLLQENAFDNQTYGREFQHHVSKLSTGCPVLDCFLQGGLSRRGITEFAGESGSGKTQICVQLCTVAQLPVADGGIDGAVLYICTESAFPIKRLRQLLESNQASKSQQKALSDKIFIEHIEDVDGLLTCLERKLPIFINVHNVKLLIIDSVAALFRSQFGAMEAIQRAQKLNVLGHALHKVNAKFGVVIVCINQVTDIIGEDNNSFNCQACGPSLGLAWSNIVNTRIMLSRTTTNFPQPPICMDDSGKSLRVSINVRKMAVVFSPSLPSGWCYFIIDSSGVHGLETNS